MKKLTLTLISILVLSFASFASFASEFSFRLQDNSCFDIAINDVVYKHHHFFRLKNIPSGYHKIAVYKRNSRGQKRLIYSDFILIEGRTATDILLKRNGTVDTNIRKMQNNKTYQTYVKHSGHYSNYDHHGCCTPSKKRRRTHYHVRLSF